MAIKSVDIIYCNINNLNIIEKIYLYSDNYKQY